MTISRIPSYRSEMGGSLDSLIHFNVLDFEKDEVRNSVVVNCEFAVDGIIIEQILIQLEEGLPLSRVSQVVENEFKYRNCRFTFYNLEHVNEYPKDLGQMLSKEGLDGLLEELVNCGFFTYKEVMGTPKERKSILFFHDNDIDRVFTYGQYVKIDNPSIKLDVNIWFKEYFAYDNGVMCGVNAYQESRNSEMQIDFINYNGEVVKELKVPKEQIKETVKFLNNHRNSIYNY